MEITPPRRKDIRASIQQAFLEIRTLEPRYRAPQLKEPEVPPEPGTRSMNPSRVIVSIKDDDPGNGDLALDIAAAVGRTVAKAVGRIEALDRGRAELIQKLGGLRSSLGEHFGKWLPPSISGGAGEHRQ